jgi:hypothetical protein
MVVVEASSVSAAVNVANFVIGQTVNVETDSAMLRRIEEQSKKITVSSVLRLTRNLQRILPWLNASMKLQEKARAITRVQLESLMFSLSASRRESLAQLVIFAENLANNRAVDHSSFRRQQVEIRMFTVALQRRCYLTHPLVRCLVSIMTKSPRKAGKPFLFWMSSTKEQSEICRLESEFSPSSQLRSIT